MYSKFTNYLFLIFLYCLFLVTVYKIYITYFEVNVLLFSAIQSVLITTLLFTPVFLIKYFLIFELFEKVIIIFTFLLIGLLIAISIPTVIDRSLSFYILEKINQRGGGVKQEYMKYIFTEEYIPEHRLIDIRLTEQLESGTISINNGCVELTKKGDRTVIFSTFFRKHFLPTKRLIMGEYSNDLVNPFKNSKNLVDYECKN